MFYICYSEHMVPADYKDFLIAVVTAAASFIGLLFVAMTLIIDKSGKTKKQVTAENILAEGSYIALLDLFFVSLVALIPHTNLGYIMIIMGILGVGNSGRLLRAGMRDGVSRGILGISTVVYVVQIVYGIFMLAHSNHAINSALFLIIVFTLFSSALGRAWELTGVSSHD